MLRNKWKSLYISLVMILGFTILPCCSFAYNWEFGSMFGVKGVNLLGTQEKQQDSLIHVIQTGINRVLGILAFISLCLVLYAGFQMMTSGGDSKKYDSGISIIKNVAIGLAIIAVSRLIVSLIFYVINGATRPNLN